METMGYENELVSCAVSRTGWDRSSILVHINNPIPWNGKQAPWESRAPSSCGTIKSYFRLSLTRKLSWCRRMPPSSPYVRLHAQGRILAIVKSDLQFGIVHWGLLVHCTRYSIRFQITGSSAAPVMRRHLSHHIIDMTCRLYSRLSTRHPKIEEYSQSTPPS